MTEYCADCNGQFWFLQTRPLQILQCKSFTLSHFKTAVHQSPTAARTIILDHERGMRHARVQETLNPAGYWLEMYNQSSAFADVPYSLPCNTHSSAIATRRVTRGMQQQSIKYMPDYGGVLEIPGSQIKQSGLRRCIPFEPNPSNKKILASSKHPSDDKFTTCQPVPDCLLTTHLFNTSETDDFTVIRGFAKCLYLDSVSPHSVTENLDRAHNITTTSSKQYVCVPYPHEIKGLKLDSCARNMLLVKFHRGVKLMRFNESYKIPSPRSDCDEIPDQSALDFIGSFPSSDSSTVSDACISTNLTNLGVAFSTVTGVDVKLYDISRSHVCYRRIYERMRHDKGIGNLNHIGSRCLRQRVNRSIVPSKATYEKAQQIENDPSHMITMTMLTSNRVVMVDPRSDLISQVYADRYNIDPLFPMEEYKRIRFSSFNNNQFYLLSNMRLRAMDKRFLSQPMNSIEHMLDIIDTEDLNMKTFQVSSTKGLFETVCMNSRGQLCFITFDQSQTRVGENIGNLVNPRSLHAPILEPSPATFSRRNTDELYGLSIISERVFSDDEIFLSIGQLTNRGNLWIRGYKRAQDHDQVELNLEPCTRTAMRDISFFGSEPEAEIENRSDLLETKYKKNFDDDDCNYINVIQGFNPADVDEKLTSKRAREKYDEMRAKLQKLS